ncbi:gastrula zinc finger protein XlCGF66.1-like isoform 1-T3 [Anomaloglossus baeobatrachus]|uniref:gastrula zinc finger protein XlCGF66.1-like n=1 Tax=Anomaloglossus baeobatrachus TaxID=238106 RepID=UPI003F50CF3C
MPPSLNDLGRTGMERKHIAERIVNVTLETLSLLTGEKYCNEKEEWSRDHITTLNNDRNNGQKILDLPNKVIHLLLGEVPIRCQDITVRFSMEEWEYLEGHKDLYEDILCKNHQSVTSSEGSSLKNKPKELMSSLHAEEHYSIPQGYQENKPKNPSSTIEALTRDKETYEGISHQF